MRDMEGTREAEACAALSIFFEIHILLELERQCYTNIYDCTSLCYLAQSEYWTKYWVLKEYCSRCYSFDFETQSATILFEDEQIGSRLDRVLGRPRRYRSAKSTISPKHLPTKSYIFTDAI